MSLVRLSLLVAWFLVPLSTPQAQAAAGAAAQAPPPTQPDFRRATKHWNVESVDGALLALQGWDPVACFPEGGGQSAKGSPKLSAVHGGVTYRFASEEHRTLFLADPWRYEPAYGGWCAYAMADGEKVEVDPESFRVLDGRLFLFYDGFFGDTRAKWLKDEAGLLKKADAAWPRLAGESNRGDAARAEALRAAAEAAPAATGS
jgi:YHS domain-containing protein